MERRRNWGRREGGNGQKEADGRKELRVYPIRRIPAHLYALLAACVSITLWVIYGVKGHFCI